MVPFWLLRYQGRVLPIGIRETEKQSINVAGRKAPKRAAAKTVEPLLVLSTLRRSLSRATQLKVSTCRENQKGSTVPVLFLSFGLPKLQHRQRSPITTLMIWDHTV